MGDLGALLSSIFTGGIGLSQLGGGSGSVSGSAAAGAAAADPFASQRGQYQGQLASLFGQMPGVISGAGNANQNIINQLMGLSGNGTTSTLTSMFQNPQQLLGGIVGSQVPGMNAGALGSPAALQSQLSQLSSNYMDNPAIKAQYNLGLDTVQRGLQAGGYGASGEQMKELSDYGQNFASQAYQQQFQNILSSNQQAYGQNLSNTQMEAALAGQQFGQNVTAQGLLNSMQQQRFGEGLNLNSQLAGIFGQAGSLQNASSGQQISGYGNLLQQLLTGSGATTGSPATAGGILSGQFANNQQALANLGSGLAGALGGQNASGGNNLMSLARQLGNMFNGGGGGLFSSALGSGALGDLFGGGGIFGGSAGTLGTMTDVFGNVIPGFSDIGGAGYDIAGSLLGFNSGATTAAGAGAGEAGAAGAGFGGAAALAAAPFALAIGGMLGGIFGGSDNGTPFTQAQDSLAQAMLHNPQLAMQYGNAPGGDALSAYMAQNFGGGGGWTMGQYAQAQQQLQANGGSGAFFGSFLGGAEQGMGG